MFLSMCFFLLGSCAVNKWQNTLIQKGDMNDAINNAIKENETTSEFLERKLGGLGAAYDVLKGKLFGFVEELISSNDKTTK